MFKLNSILSSVLRSNILIDLAVETKESIETEVKTAAIALFVLGFGAALLLGGVAMFIGLGAGIVQSVHSEFAEAFAGTSLGAGFLISVASGMRLKRALNRLNTIKDLLTAKGARDAATRLASAGIDMAMNGAASAQEFARNAASQATDSISRLFQKKGTEDATAATDSSAKQG
jgi:hypothetical protein